jgi:hypothetical protein
VAPAADSARSVLPLLLMGIGYPLHDPIPVIIMRMVDFAIVSGVLAYVLARFISGSVCADPG